MGWELYRGTLLMRNRPPPKTASQRCNAPRREGLANTREVCKIFLHANTAGMRAPQQCQDAGIVIEQEELLSANQI